MKFNMESVNYQMANPDLVLMSLTNELDANENDWIDLAKTRWHTIGIKNVNVETLQSYEINDSYCEDLILSDIRSSAIKMKKIGNVFLLLATIIVSLLLLSIFGIGRSLILGNEAKSMDYLFLVLLAILFILLQLFLSNQSKPPHYRLTRNGNELCIEKWTSYKSDSILNNTTRASLHLYELELEHSRFYHFLLLFLIFINPMLAIATISGPGKQLVLEYWIDGKKEYYGLDPRTVIFEHKVDDFIERFLGRS